MRSDSASHTARLVARSLVLASRDARLSHLLAPHAATVLSRIPEVSSGCFGVMVDWRWMRRLLFAIERIALPGVIAHYLVRKLAIEDEVRHALGSGVGRVLLIGAGFDTLASRLHGEFPEVRWIEVDHPATQVVKARALDRAANLEYRPHDLTGPEPVSRMPDVADDAAVPAVIVIEGVTMYLTPEKAADLLGDAARLAGPGGRVILTFMETDRGGSIGFRGQHPLVRWWLGLRAEPFLWGASRQALGPFLHGCGLLETGLLDHDHLRETFLTPRGLGEIPLAEGECLCTCIPILS